MAIAALPFHWTPLLSPSGMLHALRPLADLRDEFGATVTAAIQNDVNGCAWSWADLLPSAGVHGLTMGVNPYRGVRLETDPDVFLWRGPAGGSLHVAHVPHYAHGITLYGVGDMAEAERELLAHVRRLEAGSDYPWRFLYLQVTHPSRHDNGPPYEELPDFVLAWNEAGRGPPMQLATVDTLFEAIRSEPPETIRERSGDWPDWWADGAGSSAFHTALDRAANRLLPVAASLDALLGAGNSRPGADGADGSGRDRPAGGSTVEDGSAALSSTAVGGSVEDGSVALPHAAGGVSARGRPARGGTWEQHEVRELLDRALGHALRYDEHTWGSFASVSHPHAAHARALWNDKAGHAYRAFAFALEALAAIGRGMTSTLLGIDTTGTRRWRLPVPADPESNRYLLVNPSAWTRNVALELPADPTSPRPYAVPAALLGEDPSPPVDDQPAEDGDRYLSATLPPFGFRVVAYRRRRHEPTHDGEVESTWYRVRVDPGSGGLLSWYDKQLDRELAGGSAPWRFAQPIWEGIDSPAGRNALFELDLDHPSYGTLRRDAPLVRRGARGGKFVEARPSPLGPQASAELELPGARSLRVTYRLPVHRKALEIEYRILLELDETPQAVYVPFPFALDTPRYYLDLNGVPQQVPGDTLTGRWTDWYAVQGWAAAASPGTAVVVAPLDAPLVQLGGIRTGRWGEEPSEPFPGIVSWPVSNYWDTNFRASQAGLLRLRYVLGSTAEFDVAEASRFAADSALPVFAFHAPDAPDAEGRLLSVEPEGVAQVQVRRPRDGRGLIVVAQGHGGAAPTILIGVPGGTVQRAWLCSSLEEDVEALPVENGSVRLPLAGSGVVQARLEVEPRGGAHGTGASGSRGAGASGAHGTGASVAGAPGHSTPAGAADGGSDS